MMAATQRYEDDAEGAVTAVRSVRRRELLRTAAAELCFPGGNDPPQTPPAHGGAARPPYPPGRGLPAPSYRLGRGLPAPSYRLGRPWRRRGRR